MDYPLTRVQVHRGGFIFVCGPTRYESEVDTGLFDNELQAFFRGFAEPMFAKHVSAGWKVYAEETWRRSPVQVTWRGESGLRWLHVQRPNGKIAALEFRFRALPERVVAELQAYAAGFKESDHGTGQQRHESVPAEEGSADAGRDRGVDEQEHEGGSGKPGAGDGLEELPRREAGGTGRGRKRRVLAVEPEEGITQPLLDKVALKLKVLRGKGKAKSSSKGAK